MDNPHVLSAELQSVLDVQIDYHRAKLHQFQRRQDRLAAERAGKKPFSLARAVRDMGHGGLKSESPDYQLLEKAATLAGVHFDPHRVFIPWALLQPQRELEQRDLTVASAGTGGYLVATSVGSAVDLLSGWSVVASAGITLLDGLVGGLAIPRVTTPPTGYAIPTEATAITESQPVLGQSVLEPKNLACFVEFSRLLAQQANAETLVRMVLLSTLAISLGSNIYFF